MLRCILLCCICCASGDMYQHFEVSTPSIRLLQEVTDKASDASTSTSSQPYLARLHQRQHNARQQHQHQQQQERTSSRSDSSRDDDAVRDTEAGLVAAQGGLTDWRGLERHLQSWTWNGRFSRLAGRFRYNRLQELLSQREVSRTHVASTLMAEAIGATFGIIIPEPSLCPPKWALVCLPACFGLGVS